MSDRYILIMWSGLAGREWRAAEVVTPQPSGTVLCVSLTGIGYTFWNPKGDYQLPLHPLTRADEFTLVTEDQLFALALMGENVTIVERTPDETPA